MSSKTFYYLELSLMLNDVARRILLCIPPGYLNFWVVM